jgi:hypothetical protein
MEVKEVLGELHGLSSEDIWVSIKLWTRSNSGTTGYIQGTT